MTDHGKGDIIAVDDSSSFLALLTDTLKAEGYRVHSANNGELALQLAASAPPELVLLDINLPGMNGFDVCRRLRARPETRDTPIVFISTLQETVEKVKGFELGAVDYITKPYQREELLARVRTHLELHRLRRHFKEMVEMRTAELSAGRAALARSNRELRSLSRCDKVIVRATDERTLLDGICRTVCEEADYRMAWAGYAGAAKDAPPAAWAGFVDGFFACPSIGWAGTEQEPGPAGMAIQSGEPCRIQDIAAARQNASSWDSALQRGYRSCIFIPLKNGSANVFGLLSVYSAQPNTFTPDEFRLLEDLASDLAFGVTAMRDRIERNRAEAEVRALNQQLEHRVAERTAALELANQELESFSYSVSHDLRAPLRAIDGFSQILLEEYGDKLDEECRRYTAAINLHAVHMGHLISDTLAFSRMSRGEIAMAQVHITALAKEVFEEQRATAPAERNIVLHMGTLPPAYGDRAMLRQVLVNVISNAIKYTGPRAEAVIEVNGTAAGEDTSYGSCQPGIAANTYWVKDNGVGFDMGFADKIFGVFQRLHGDGEFEGTGIGLAIVKRIVTRHGGRVWVESKLNEGTTLYFTLPASMSKHEG